MIAPTNLTATTIRCTNPTFPPYIPVSLATCYETFNILLNAPDVDVRHNYRSFKSGPIQLTGTPCAISVDAGFAGAKLTISKRHLVERVRWILVQCAAFGQGGWATIEGSENWVAIIEGVRVVGVVNGTDNNIIR